ncbi:MAG: hypothetical protein QOJ74_210, partial [Ilumatobacteraceae bacterium]|nr:hypothetical protein [Ilumatobacteraceae bacterium]
MGRHVKITDVSVVVHERPLPAGMPLPPMEMAVLRIHTDEGIEGNTFITPPGPNVTDQILKQVKPMLIGRDPLDIGAIWHGLWAKRRGMHSTVQGYVDVALWDIAGKAAGLPIHRLLGTVRHELPAYISSWRRGGRGLQGPRLHGLQAASTDSTAHVARRAGCDHPRRHPRVR